MKVSILTKEANSTAKRMEVILKLMDIITLNDCNNLNIAIMGRPVSVAVDATNW